MKDDNLSVDWEYIYAMLSAEFHYTEEYINEHMDMPKFIAHLKYREDNPPAGAVLKSVLDSFAEKGGEKTRYKHAVSTPVEEVAGSEMTTSEFLGAFAGFGGGIKVVKAEEVNPYG